MKHSILVVDDDRVIAEGIATRLQRAGHACRTVHSAAEALEAAAREHFDLSILDVGLPDMSGVELASSLHRWRPGLALLIVTGHDFCLRLGLGADEMPDVPMLQKPFHLDELAVKVQELLEGRKTPSAFALSQA